MGDWMRLATSAIALLLVLLTPLEGAVARPGGGHTFDSPSRSDSSSSERYRYESSSSHDSRSGSPSANTPVWSPSKYPQETAGSARDPALRQRWTVGSTIDLACANGRCKPMAGDFVGDWHGVRRKRKSNLVAFIVVGFLGGPPLVLLLGWALTRRRRAGWTTGSVHPRPQRVSMGARLQALVATDPDFSRAAFEEHVQAICLAAHVARGSGGLDRMGAYLRPEARTRLTAAGTLPATQVIVGALRIADVRRGEAEHSVVIEIELSYTETRAEGLVPVYATERWTLWRAHGVRTKPPLAVRVLRCPSCGASLDQLIGATCGYCRQVVDDGRFDWVVQDITTVARRSSSPVSLGGHAPERGTTSPTIVDPQLPAALAALAQTSGFSADEILARTHNIFEQMNAAWSTLQWERARPLLARPLFEMQRYWIEAYRAQGLRNVVESAMVTDLQFAAVTIDRWYESVTLRVFATGLDYTLRGDGAIVGGSRSQRRSWSEYWTLVRGRGGGGAASCCPSCGAPLILAASTKCGHCHAAVEAQHYAWVLARIEQDEVYAGAPV